MTDLLTRVRAYVAAIPTHSIVCRGVHMVTVPRQDTPADALLREVAALEPVAHMHGDATVRPMKKDSAFSWEKKVQFSIPLYALTGAGSHD